MTQGIMLVRFPCIVLRTNGVWMRWAHYKTGHSSGAGGSVRHYHLCYCPATRQFRCPFVTGDWESRPNKLVNRVKIWNSQFRAISKYSWQNPFPGRLLSVEVDPRAWTIHEVTREHDQLSNHRLHHCHHHQNHRLDHQNHQNSDYLKVNKERNGCIAHSLFGAIGSQDVEVVFHNLSQPLMGLFTNFFLSLISYIYISSAHKMFRWSLTIFHNL